MPSPIFFYSASLDCFVTVFVADGERNKISVVLQLMFQDLIWKVLLNCWIIFSFALETRDTAGNFVVQYQ